jgi:hypothetical protein
MIYLRSDQYTYVSRDCPASIDMHPVDDVVEIALGEYRFGGDVLRLVIDHPDTFVRLSEALHDARNRLVEHLRRKACPDPAMSGLQAGEQRLGVATVDGFPQ